MDDMKRGDDAADHAPRPKDEDKREAQREANDNRQDAPNYKRTDKGQAIRDEDVSSANDE